MHPTPRKTRARSAGGSSWWLLQTVRPFAGVMLEWSCCGTTSLKRTLRHMSPRLDIFVVAVAVAVAMVTIGCVAAVVDACAVVSAVAVVVAG